MQRRQFISILPLLALSPWVTTVAAATQSPATRLVQAARSQVGITRHYDPAYTRLAYPGGDVSMEKGVCTDVLIRAYRRAFNYDLQKTVHEDMRQHFAAYPKIWGLKRADPNIDHRRVPNLQIFFRRKQAELALTNKPADYLAGDLVTQLINGKLPHILIVSDRKTIDGVRPLVIHNIGAGAQEEDALFSLPITGHYRFFP